MYLNSEFFYINNYPLFFHISDLFHILTILFILISSGKRMKIKILQIDLMPQEKLNPNENSKVVVAKCSTNTAQNRGGSRTTATFKMERFVIIVNGFQPVTIITKNSTLDVTAVLDPPLQNAEISTNFLVCFFQCCEQHETKWKLCICTNFWVLSSVKIGYLQRRSTTRKNIAADNQFQ